MFPKPIEKSSLVTQILYKISLPMALIIWLLPLIAVAITSVRSAGDINSGNYWGWPKSFDLLENYTAIFVQTEIGTYIRNSFIVTLPTVFFTICLSSLTGFAFGVYKFKFDKILFFIFVAGNFIPFQILMVPVRDLTLHLGIYNTFTGLILFHVAFQTGFCTLFMRNFISNIPKELIESARVEGVSEFKIFFYIIVPLMRPAMAALAVLIFTFIWNDYFWATVLTQGADTQPITAGLYSLNGQWLSAWHLVSAGSIVAAIPPIAMFFIMQKHFIRGLTLGAVK